MNSIMAGIVLALLGWLHTRYQAFMEMYRHMKQELEQMREEMTRLGATKEEFERLRESLRWSEAQRQKLQRQLEEERHEIVLLLLGYGANINARDDKGRTALMLAATHFNTRFVEFLLMFGAYINAEDYNGWTALSWAAKSHYRPIANLLRSYGAKE